jgi:hypothetical protein
MPKPYVFISYSQQDRNFVERLTTALSAAGVETWRDVANIAPGENWQQQVEKGLLNAEVLLYVSSRHTSNSVWVAQELRGFLRGPGRVIPLILDVEGAHVLPDELRVLHAADFRGDFDDAVERLLVHIDWLRQSEPVARPQTKSKGYVFISYAAEDADFVRQLKAHMKARGYAYWDFRESERNYQLDYTIELEEVISKAAATLSVVSPEWKKSPTSLKELHFSEEVSTPVFLLRVRDPGPTLALAGKTFIEFTTSPEAGFSKLDVELSKFGL